MRSRGWAWALRALRRGYRVFGKMADDGDFRGILLVRKDSGIREVADLRGEAVSYPAPTALAAAMLPQYFLRMHGLDVNRDIDNRYVGSQESSILSVLHGDVAAGATWPMPWKLFQREHPQEAAQLEVKWQTATLPSNGWVVRPDVPQPVQQRFTERLLRLHESAAGRAMLERLPVSRFEPADESTYASVRAFLEEFSAAVRPVAW